MLTKEDLLMCDTPPNIRDVSLELYKEFAEEEGFAEMAHGVNESATAQALTQVEEGIEQISTVTQQNAAASEECSAISEELAARATEMTNQIQKFNLFD